MNDVENRARADLARRRDWHERQMRKHRRVAIAFVVWLVALAVAMGIVI